ncbi:hypothetical protein NDU88_000340 [Pleurodeles waltl]|uniref:Uncharacterized protein n=1 Tax=Pleurodeles waltl TaxID=8319 RepID=A0AAV7NBL7_PLEWA|nr:hypothetical protein NDU88_000340 [Pleurodeles waltl]
MGGPHQASAAAHLPRPQSSVSRLASAAGAPQEENQREYVQPRPRRHTRPGRTVSGMPGANRAPSRESPGPTPIRRGKAQLGVRRGRIRRPDASGSCLPLSERGEALQARRSPRTHLKAGEAANR